MKLLFVCNNLHIGGIQRALINLLVEIGEKHDVTLFLFYPKGELTDVLPPNIKLICGNCFTSIMGMSQAEAKNEGIFAWMWRSLWTVATRIFGSSLSFGFLTRMQKLKTEYDCSISFMQNTALKTFYGGCNEFVINSTNAKKKVSFVHCDFKNYFGNNEYNKNYYKNFDTIACVSDSCKKVFDKECPEYVNKTVSVYNCYNYKEMQQKSNEFIADYTDGKINIFTSARISEEKGIFRMIDIFYKLKNQGCKFVWRVAGDGILYDKAVEESRHLGLQDDIIFLGMQKNPYPYYKNADMLLVPSYNEAAPMVFGEAMCFGVPIFTTDTTSATEIVENNNAGFVCANDDKEIEKKLGELLYSPEVIKNKKYGMYSDNDKAVKEFENIIL